MNDIDSLRDRTRQSLLETSEFYRISSPIFSSLARDCAADVDIIDLCAATRRGQLAGMLLMCVVHYLVMKSPDSKLARYYPSVSEAPLPMATAFPVFREFCLDHAAQVADLLSWRTVNTNLAEKATCLLPALAHVARHAGEPLTLVEICCSSGLNMLFDEYRYDYGPLGCVGPEVSPIRLRCKVVGKGRPPVEAIPAIARRVGVDLVYMDVSKPDERLWMEAVLAPEWTEELVRLRQALELRRQRDLRIIQGDALEILPQLLEELPGPLCILQSYCIGHWSMAARGALEDLLLRYSRDRVIHRIAIEGPESEPPEVARTRLIRLSAAGIPILQKSSPSTIDHLMYADSRMSSRRLGEGSIFGTWLDWHVAEPQVSAMSRTG
jgi:hypothetical protein